MAPVALFFNVHTDDWGNHRTGVSSLATAVGGFLTDMWGSHRGGSTSAAAAAAAAATGKGGIVTRSIEHGQGVYLWVEKSLMAGVGVVPVWWSIICVIDLLMLIAVVFFFCPRAFSLHTRGPEQEDQRPAVEEVVEGDKTEETDTWV